MFWPFHTQILLDARFANEVNIIFVRIICIYEQIKRKIMVTVATKNAEQKIRLIKMKKGRREIGNKGNVNQGKPPVAQS